MKGGFIFLVFLCLIKTDIVFSQVDSILNVDMDTTFSLDGELENIFREKGIFPEIDYSEIAMLSSFKKVREELKMNVKKGLIPKIATTLAMDNFYYSGDSSYLYPKDIIYSTLRVGTKLTTFGLPIKATATVSAVNGNIDKDFSNFSLDFDIQKSLKMIGKRFVPTNEGVDLSYFEMLKNSVNLSKIEEFLLQKELKTSVYQKIIAHPKYTQLKDSLYQKQKSLFATRDSIINQDSLSCKFYDKYQSRSDSIKVKLEKLKDFENEYHQLWKSKATRLNGLKDLKNRITDLKNKVEDFSNPEKLKLQLQKNGVSKLIFKEKLAIFLKGASLGLVSINDREFTFKNLSVVGGLIEYEGKKIFSSVGYGKHNLSRNLSIFSDRFFTNRYDGNRFLFLKAGLGKLDGNFAQVSILRSTKRSNSAGFVIPNNNIVIATALRQTVTKTSALITDIAVSKQDVLPVDINGVSSSPNKDNMAFSMKSELKLWKEQLKVDLGYFQIGPTFYSSGNPFLLRNRKGVLGAIETSILNNRILLKGRINYAVSKVSEVANTVPFKRFDFSGEAKIKLAKKHRITLKYSPSNNYRSLENNQVNAINYFYLAQSNSQFSFTSRTKLLSVISFTNLQSTVDANDTTFTLENTYLLAQETLVFGQKSISMMGLLSSQYYFQNSISDYLYQVSFRQSFKKLTYSISSKLEMRRWDQIERMSFIGGVKYSFKSYAINLQTAIGSPVQYRDSELSFSGQFSLFGNF